MSFASLSWLTNVVFFPRPSVITVILKWSAVTLSRRQNGCFVFQIILKKRNTDGIINLMANTLSEGSKKLPRGKNYFVHSPSKLPLTKLLDIIKQGFTKAVRAKTSKLAKHAMYRDRWTQISKLIVLWDFRMIYCSTSLMATSWSPLVKSRPVTRMSNETSYWMLSEAAFHIRYLLRGTHLMNDSLPP